MSGQQRTHELAPLAGLTVLELGDGVAGAAATDALAALGAAVTTVAASDSVLRALCPQLDGSSVLSAVLDARKQVAAGIAGDRLLREISLAHVVVCDRVHRATERSAQDSHGYRQRAAADPRRARAARHRRRNAHAQHDA